MSEPEPPPPAEASRNKGWVLVFAGTLVTLLMLVLAGRITYGSDFFDDMQEAAFHLLGGYSVHSKSMVSRAKADQRSMATAIESYLVDCSAYPAMRPFTTLPNGPAVLAAAHASGLSMAEPGSTKLLGLTTPVAYLTKLFADPFTGSPRPRFFYDGKFFTQSQDKDPLPLAYYRPPGGWQGWIVFSAGPNHIYEVDPVKMYDPTTTVPSAALVNATYDPTNGALSAGDVVRWKQ